MGFTVSIHDLLSYTEWQRNSWQQWFRDDNSGALAAGTGPNGDGRFPTIGALVRHIFSAELRYAERITGQPLTDTATVPTDEVEALFGLGMTGRQQFVRLVETLPREQWDTPLEFPLMSSTVRLSARKIVAHVLTHEIRHWAQVATLLRLAGWKVPPQDLLFSPALGEPVLL